MRRQRVTRDVAAGEPLTIRSPEELRRGDVIEVTVRQSKQTPSQTPSSPKPAWRFDANSALFPKSWPAWKRGFFSIPTDQADLGNVNARARVAKPHLCPQLSDRGTLVCQYDRRHAAAIKAAKGHIMMQIGHRDWEERVFVPSEPMRIHLRFRLLGDVDRWSEDQWFLIWQSWSAKITGAVCNEPPISLIKPKAKHEWYLRILNGSRHDRREEGTNQFYMPLGIPATQQWVSLDIEFDKGQEGFIRAFRKGRTLVEYHGPTELADANRRTQQMMFGYYSYQSKHPHMGVEFSHFEIEE